MAGASVDLVCNFFHRRANNINIDDVIGYRTPTDAPFSPGDLGPLFWYQGASSFYTDSGLTSPVNVPGTNFGYLKNLGNGSSGLMTSDTPTGITAERDGSSNWYVDVPLHQHGFDATGVSLGTGSMTGATIAWAGICKTNATTRGQMMMLGQYGSAGNYMTLECNTYNSAGNKWGFTAGASSWDTDISIVADEPVVMILRHSSIHGSVASSAEWFKNGVAATLSIRNASDDYDNGGYLDVSLWDFIRFSGGQVDREYIQSYCGLFFNRALTNGEILNLGTALAESVGTTWLA